MAGLNGGRMLDKQFPNSISGQIVDAAIKVHRFLGPGLLESVYQTCLVHELRSRGLDVREHVPVAIVYEGITLKVGYRIDLLVEGCVVMELKAVVKLLPIHEAQLLSYMRLSRCRLGLLVNFHEAVVKNGIKRMVL